MALLIEDKKDNVLRFITLGMSEDKAYLIAEVDDEEKALMLQDPMFANRLRLAPLIEEERLLQKFEEVLQISTARGKSDDIKWKLAVLNKERYGSGERAGSGSGIGEFKERFVMRMNFKEGTASLETADNVEVFRAPAKPDEDLGNVPEPS